MDDDLDRIEKLIWLHNEALEKAREAWLEGDLGSEAYDKLMLASSPAAHGLPMFVDPQQAERAKAQWKQIGERLNQRIALLDKIIFTMQVLEGAGQVATALLGIGVLAKALVVGGKLVFVKTLARVAVGGVVAGVAGKTAAAGMRAAGADEETIEGVQTAVEIISWLLVLRRINSKLPTSSAPATKPPPQPATPTPPNRPPKASERTPWMKPREDRRPSHRMGRPEAAATNKPPAPRPKGGPLTDGDFRLDKHSNFPSPRPPDTNSHHGVLSKWMKTNFPGYNPEKAPAILMPTPNHRRTYGVFNSWRAQMEQKMGGKLDWKKITEQDIRELSERMFDAASVPSKIRAEYWVWFESMIAALQN